MSSKRGQSTDDENARSVNATGGNSKSPSTEGYSCKADADIQDADWSLAQAQLEARSGASVEMVADKYNK